MHDHLVVHPRSSASPKGGASSSFREDARDPSVYGTLDDPFYKGTPARTWSFPLDTFQSQACACVERSESVLVAAHTSAGKTVVAEYAVAKALQENARVIYTSPLKALSNQKFRELSEEFNTNKDGKQEQNVGIMTGDVTLHTNAPVLVMTTEIMRSMMYKGNDEVMGSVRYVVFDEVHYMTDKERGVVWEETIIMMPSNVTMVFLSATLANAHDFASWIASVHNQPCHVISTSKRPTPLVHYGFPCVASGPSKGAPPGSSPPPPKESTGLYLVVDENGRFVDESFDKLSAVIATHHASTTTTAGGGQHGGGGGGSGDGAPPPSSSSKPARAKPASPKDLQRIMKLLHARDLHPAIVFAFSRRECEHNALQVSKLDFLPDEESKAQVASIYDAALMSLPEADRSFAPLASLKPLLQRGVGVHHSGLLPMVKEVVEILFQEGFLRVLFTTETFAMGLNMPARTVVFTSLSKFDGEKVRHVSSGEYIQMSGRAGRRGVDSVGMVIFLATYDPPENVDAQTSIVGLDKEVFKSIMLGKPKPLVSEFRLTYYTLLNLIRRSASGSMSGSWTGVMAASGASKGKRKRGVQGDASPSQAAAASALSYQEHVISMSFHAHQRESVCRRMRREASQLLKRAQRLEAGLVNLDDSDDDAMDNSYDEEAEDGDNDNDNDSDEDGEMDDAGKESAGDGANANAFSRACDARDVLLNKLRKVEDAYYKCLRKAVDYKKNAPLMEAHLQAGRMVKVRLRERDVETDWGWGIVLAVMHKDATWLSSGGTGASSKVGDMVVDVLVEAAPRSSPREDAVPPRWRTVLYAGRSADARSLPPPPEAEPLPSVSDAAYSEMCPVRFPLSAIVGISAGRLSLPRDLTQLSSRQAVLSSLREMQRRFPKGLPRLHPVEDMKLTIAHFATQIKDSGKDKQHKRRAAVVSCAEKHKDVCKLEEELGANAAFQAAFDAFVAPKASGGGPSGKDSKHKEITWEGKRADGVAALDPRVLLASSELRRRAARLREAAEQTSLAAFRRELNARKRVLRSLGHLEVHRETGDGTTAPAAAAEPIVDLTMDDDASGDAPGTFDVVTLKGRAACHVDIADELLTTELLFNGGFNALTVPQLCALCSCLLPETEKTAEAIKLRSELQSTLEMLQEAATRVAEVAFDCGVAPPEAERETFVSKYVESFQPGLMDVAFEWSRGLKTFAEIADMTDLFEGSIVRSLRRLVEFLDNLHNACVEVGESSLAEKFEEAHKSISRGIVHANSLYL